MSRLKEKSFKKCISLLREFVDESTIKKNKKKVAVLALDHLQRITAGSSGENGCYTKPRADGSPYGG